MLEDIFLVKRLLTIQKFFAMCRNTAYAFRGEAASVYEGGLAGVYSDEQLNKPIRLFTADYVSRQLIGVTSQSLGIALCFLLQRMGLSVGNEIEQRDIGAESKVGSVLGLLFLFCGRCGEAMVERGVCLESWGR